jgi:hypothetical protein
LIYTYIINAILIVLIISMKTPKHIKKIKDETTAFLQLLETYCAKLKKEHQKICLEQTNQLISAIAKGENLDEYELRQKYLNIKEKKSVESNNIELDDELLLDKVVLNEQTYYYENKENGNIFNASSKQVGNFSKGQFIINSKVQLNEA